MNSILYLALVLASFVPNAPDLPESFSLRSLDALDAQCPEFRKDASDAILSFTCYENSRSLILSKALIFDGRSFIQDPDTHAKKILVDVRAIIHEDFTIKDRTKFCEVRKDSYGRCKTVYTLVGTRNFDDAALAINPIDGRIDGFSYFVGLRWHSQK
ncbi:hypothetical protein [Rhizobium aegyptiacum]|uniref:hypothetical protein n=1 Tax=Rhizobium aegyptiacum TaxID=1764550 RepID=UPI0012E75A35|nr:hypothetical protein [Rhizobium aegyptiacum]